MLGTPAHSFSVEDRIPQSRMASKTPEVTFNFTGKRALVTGGSRGLGRVIALELAAAGADTYALSNVRQDLDDLAKECPSIHIVYVDLTDWTATRQAIEALPPIDLLVNNAVVLILSAFVDIKPEDIDAQFAVNLRAIFNVSQVVAKSLIARGSPGSIVNIGSAATERAVADLGAYCTFKGGLEQLTRVMALELGQHKIRVNSVNPTAFKTGIGFHFHENPRGDQYLARTPLGRFGEVSEVVPPVLFLLSDAASMISGVGLFVDGGYTAH